MSKGSSGPRKPRRKRWGLRTLGFLVLGITAVVTSQIQGFYSPGTLICTFLGVGGAAYCSVRGWQALQHLEWLDKK